MKLEFDEPQSSYTSGSQSARSWTEAWVSRRAYCPHCGNAKMSQFPNNSPVADFLCASCNEEFELKSQKGKFGAKVADGAYKTKCERLVASNNPNLLLMNYDLKTLAVVNLFIIPKHFFVRDIIEERKPLAATARRAGWIGSNILLGQVPQSGKIHIVQNGVVRPKEIVLQEWQRTLFLRDQSLEARGWLLDVMKCVESLGSAISRSTKSTLSNDIWATSIPATRTSNPRYASNFNFCVIADLLISCRVAVIVYDHRIETMAWFLNFYKCDRCKRRWTDEWSCMCDDECPNCGARDMTPVRSEDLTELIEQEGDKFVALRSPGSAEHDPDYRELGRFSTRAKAEECLALFEEP